jgi:hypothetical protein
MREFSHRGHRVHRGIFNRIDRIYKIIQNRNVELYFFILCILSILLKSAFICVNLRFHFSVSSAAKVFRVKIILIYEQQYSTDFR